MKRIAILGATGAVGGALTVHLLRSNLLHPGDELQLVGHGGDEGAHKLLASRIDLLDAFDEEAVKISIVPDIDSIEADIVIMAAGATISPEAPSRRDLAQVNLPVFMHAAERCVSRLPSAMFIVVGNPVELCVEIFSRATQRHHVFGMGAQQDSLRFARAIAQDLGVTRNDVRASVLWEHGECMLPIWSSIELLEDSAVAQARLVELLQSCAGSELVPDVTALRAATLSLVGEEAIDQAYRLTQSARPDARVFVEQSITAHALHSTPNATANATLTYVAAALANDRRRIHGQVKLEGEDFGIHGVCGIPLTLGHSGWSPDASFILTDSERQKLKGCAASIQAAIHSVLGFSADQSAPTT